MAITRVNDHIDASKSPRENGRWTHEKKSRFFRPISSSNSGFRQLVSISFQTQRAGQAVPIWSKGVVTISRRTHLTVYERKQTRRPPAAGYGGKRRRSTQKTAHDERRERKRERERERKRERERERERKRKREKERERERKRERERERYHVRLMCLNRW